MAQVKQSPSSKSCDGAATPKVGENLDTSCSQSSKKTPGRQKAKVFPEDATPDLIRLVHGNFHNKIFLVKEFSAFLQKLDRKDEKSKSHIVYSILPESNSHILLNYLLIHTMFYSYSRNS